MSTLVSKKRKHPIPSGTHQNKVPRKGPDLTLPSRDKHTTLQAEAHSVSSVKDQVRKSINRWVKEQPPGMLKSLSESQHFVIDVKETHTHGQLVAAVRCGACKKSIRLQAKEVLAPHHTSYQIGLGMPDHVTSYCSTKELRNVPKYTFTEKKHWYL